MGLLLLGEKTSDVNHGLVLLQAASGRELDVRSVRSRAICGML